MNQTLFDVRTPNGTALFSTIGGQLVQFTLDTGQQIFWTQNGCNLSDTKSLIEDFLPYSGCPLSSPWFGQMAANPSAVQSSFSSLPSYPVHGVVRSVPWTFSGSETNVASVRVKFDLSRFRLTDDVSIPLHWQIEYIFTSSSLTVLVSTHNLGQETLTISQGLHNYFALDRLSNTQLRGLGKVSGWDAEKNWQDLAPLSEILPLKNMDWVLEKVQQPIQWTGQKGLTLKMELIGCENLVLWNPGAHHPLTQKYWHSNEGWQSFFCIEPSQLLSNAPTLAANQKNTFGYTLILA